MKTSHRLLTVTRRGARVYLRPLAPALVLATVLTAGGLQIHGAHLSLIGANTLVGGDGAVDRAPQMAWNSATDEFLYVWNAETFETGKCRDYSGGAIRAKIVKASDVGVADASAGFLTLAGTASGAGLNSCPVATYNPSTNNYLVMWMANKGTKSKPNNDIWGRTVAADGTLGPVAKLFPSARYPFLEFNPGTGEYLVAYVTQAAPGYSHTIVARSSSSTGAAGSWIIGYISLSIANPSTRASRGPPSR